MAATSKVAPLCEREERVRAVQPQAQLLELPRSRFPLPRLARHWSVSLSRFPAAIPRVRVNRVQGLRASPTPARLVRPCPDRDRNALPRFLRRGERLRKQVPLLQVPLRSQALPVFRPAQVP